MPAETGAQDLSPSLKEQYRKARQAFDRNNLDYAITLLENILRQAPSCYEAREMLRATQIRRHAGRKGFLSKMLGAAGNSSALARAQLLLRSKPEEAMAVCESILSGNPDHVSAHRSLAQAAMACEFHHTAVLSLEVAHRHHPGDRHIVFDLCQALFGIGKAARAETLLQELAARHPRDPEIIQAFKDASARRSLSEGGYQNLGEDGGTYRDIIRDRDQAARLQEEEKLVQTTDSLQQRIDSCRARLEGAPENLSLVRELADLHRKRGDIQQAIHLFRQLTRSERGSDPEIWRTLANLQSDAFAAREEAIDPADEDCQEKREAIAREREVFRLENARAMAERFPTDTALRFELGERLFEAGEISAAIKELQKAQKNAHLKHRARRLLAGCFSGRGMLDLAERTLKTSLAEKQEMDEERKELLYDLGTVQERSGRMEEAIEQFKSIYEVDIDFRDVGEKVDRYYENL